MARSTSKQVLFRRHTAYSLNNTTNTTNLRNKRDLFDATKSKPFNEQRLADDVSEIPNESKSEPQFASVDNTTADDDFYPKFHVTYWMFYPYSQVRTIYFIT